MTHSIAIAARWTAALFLGFSVPMMISGYGLLYVIFAIGGLAGLIALGPKTVDVLRQTGRALASPFGAVLGILFVLWFVASIRTIDPARSPVVLASMVSVVLLIFALGIGFALDPANRERTLKTMIAAAWLAAVITLTGAHLWPPLIEYVRDNQFKTSHDVLRFLKGYGAVIPLMSVVLVWAGHRAGGLWRWAAIAYVPLGALIVFELNNRSAILGYAGAAAGGAICWYLSRVSARHAWIVAVGLLCLIAVVLTAAFAALPPVPWTKASQPTLPTWMLDPHRQIIWSFVLDRIAEEPWFGWGLDTAGRTPGAKAIIPTFTVTYVSSHPHNWVLQVFVESGVFALAALWTVIVLTARHLVRLTVAGHRDAIASAAVFGGFLASSMVNFSFFAYWWQLVHALLFALPLSVAWQAQRAGKAART